MAKKGKTRRKSRSAAQKRASKRNIKKAQASRRRNKPKTRRKSRKSNKPKKNTKKRMAGNKGKKKIIDKIPILKNKTVQRIGFGLGMGVIAVGIIDLAARFGPPALVAPLVQNKRIIKLGVEAVTEPISAVADVVLSGGLGSLNLGSLSGNRQDQMIVGNGGFA